MNQKDRIIQYLKEYKSIDRLKALTELGIFELSARICELKSKGYKFNIIQNSKINRYGDIFYYKEYTLV